MFRVFYGGQWGWGCGVGRSVSPWSHVTEVPPKS